MASAWRVAHPSFFAAEQLLYRPYELLKLPATVCVISILMLFIKSGLLSPVQKALAAVGRTALSNYILTSLLCQYIFTWSRWHYYGRLTYGAHHLVLLFVWVVNIAASLLWLCFIEFGPLEWFWRSLTYWQLQPLRLTTAHR